MCPAKVVANISNRLPSGQFTLCLDIDVDFFTLIRSDLIAVTTAIESMRLVHDPKPRPFANSIRPSANFASWLFEDFSHSISVSRDLLLFWVATSILLAVGIKPGWKLNRTPRGST